MTSNPADPLGDGGRLADRDALGVISATASFNAHSMRTPFSRADG
jgi:hypothetical protein